MSGRFVEGHIGDSVKRRKKNSMSILRYLADTHCDSSTPQLVSLTQHELDLKGVDGCLSPGSFFGNRVAIQDVSHQMEEGKSGHRMFVASGRNVYKIDNECMGEKSHPDSLKKGKGGMYLPSRKDQMRVGSEIVPMLQMRAEAQSIHITPADSKGDSGIILTDTYGRAVCGTLSTRESSIESVYTVQPDDGAFVCEGGWTGGVLSQYSRNIAAIARHFPKDVSIFDGNIAVRTLNTLYCPNDLTFLASDLTSSSTDATPLIAVAEGNVVTIWDLRIAGTGSRINRICTGPYAGHVYTIAAANRGCALLGASGQDRDVCIWDPRTWKTVDRWRNCLKYEVTSLHFMESNPRYCMVSGMDYEVVCGSWLNNTSKAFQASTQKKGGGRAAGPATDEGSVADTTRRERAAASFRGTSRWIGLAKAPGESDIFAGVTSDGMMYVSEFM